METKKCINCGIEKELSKFTGSESGYRTPTCASCYHAAAMKKVFFAFLDAYGNKCACCGEEDPRFLTLDHINNDGAAQKRELGLSKTDGGSEQLYRQARREGYPKDKYQILCFNCNCGKHRNKGICPHKDNYVEHWLKAEIRRLRNHGFSDAEITVKLSKGTNLQ